MKKNFIMIALASVLMMPVSCTKNEMDVPQGPSSSEFDLVEMTLEAQTEASTKTAIDLAEGTVTWTAGDAIKLVWELDKAVGEASSAALTADDIAAGSAIFNVSAPSDFAKETSDHASRHMYAVYPSSVVLDYSNASSLLVTVPDVQDGSFANASIALAKWYYGKPLAFKNLCGLVQVVVEDADVRKIVLEASENIAGKVDVGGFDGGVVNVKSVKEGKKSITVNVSGAGTYYIAVLPSSLEGFYMALYDENDGLIGDKFTDNTLTVKRKMIKPLGTLETGFGDRYYVKVDGTGDGSSWTNAASWTSLVTKLKETNAPLKVYMAAGEYKTGSVASMGTANTSAEIEIYGGYAADVAGYSIAGRDYKTNAVVLDAESKDRILVIQRGAWKIDGLTFKNAMRGATATDVGSALMIEGNASSSFVVNNCTFDGNQNLGNKGGGAVRVSNAAVKMYNCKFVNNTANQFGSAIYVGGTGVLDMVDCSLSKNNVATYDGAIYVDANATLNMDHCIFAENTAKRRAGAISAKGKVNAVNCDFDSNVATTDGGAIWMRDGGVLKCNLCTFRSNVANGTGNTNGGGAIYVANSQNVSDISKVYLNRCFMANNSDQYNGHHIYANSQYSYVGLNNCVVRGPWAVTMTQGSLLQIKGSNVIVNSTIYCQTGSWGAISLGSKTEGGCRVINDIVINKSSEELSFYSTSYYMQVYNTIYSKDKATTEGYGMTYTDCLAGASCRTGGNFPTAASLWTTNGTQFNLDGSRYIYVYPWEGTTDAGEVKKPSLADVKTLISGTANVGADFLSWLESDELKVNGVEALAMDIRGVARNTSAMWPGSYEDATASAGVENLNVK